MRIKRKKIKIKLFNVFFLIFFPNFAHINFKNKYYEKKCFNSNACCFRS